MRRLIARHAVPAGGLLQITSEVDVGDWEAVDVLDAVRAFEFYSLPASGKRRPTGSVINARGLVPCCAERFGVGAWVP